LPASAGVPTGDPVVAADVVGNLLAGDGVAVVLAMFEFGVGDETATAGDGDAVAFAAFEFAADFG
jgi:hypothetical protein